MVLRLAKVHRRLIWAGSVSLVWVSEFVREPEPGKEWGRAPGEYRDEWEGTGRRRQNSGRLGRAKCWGTSINVH